MKERRDLVALMAVLAAAFFVFDLLIPLGVAAGVPYVVLVLLGIKAARTSTVYWAAVIGTFLTLLGWALSPGSTHWMVVVNRALALGLIWVSLVLVLRLRASDSEAKKLQATNDAILTQINDAYILIDIRGCISFVNEAAERMFGYSREELIGMNIAGLTAASERFDKKEELYAYLAAELQGMLGGGGRYLARRANGEIFPIDLTATVLMVDGQQLFLGIARDITEEEATRRSAHQFKSTLDQTLDCVFMFRPDTLRFFYANEGALAQVEYSVEEMMQMTPYDIKPDYEEEDFRALVQPLIEGPDRALTFETVHQSKSGKNIPVEIFLQYMEGDGELEEPRFIAIVRDITERKKIDLLKDEFIATVSHELRTPLTSIKGALGLMDTGALDDNPEHLRKMLKVAKSNTERLSDLVNDLLDFEKIQTGNMKFTMEEVDLGKLIGYVISQNTPFAQEHDVHMRFAKIKDARVPCDEFRIGQVVTNLISNAVKFSNEGDLVELALDVKDGRAVISVKDHGIGIPETYQSHVFERFTQADGADTRSQGGTGLGLAISKAIVDHHGGVIRFETAEGEGTTFYVELPLINKADDTNN